MNSTPSGIPAAPTEQGRPVLVALIGGSAVIIAALIAGLAAISTHAKENRAPIASLRVSVDAAGPRATIKLDASGSSDPDGDPIEISVFEDGNRLAGRQPIRDLPAPHAGYVEYRITVTDGRLSNSETKVVKVP